MTGRDVRFPGTDGVQLAGHLDLPDGPVRATALFAHCFTCSHRSHAASRISRELARQGVAVLRFDFTGLGSSDGEFAETTFSGNVADVVAAARWLGEELAPVSLLVGHSLGGAAVIAAAGELDDVRGVATIGAPADPEHVAHTIEGLGAPGSAGDEPVEVRIGGRPFRLRRAFLDDVADQRQTERIAGLRRSLLVLHSPIDEIVGVDQARRIFEAARHPKSFVSLDEADHLLNDRADAQYAAGVIAAWGARFLPPAGLEEHEALDEVAGAGVDGAGEDGAVAVEELGTEGYAHAAVAGSHRWLVDEPQPIGADTGPNPYDLLLAALGACTSMTMRMYAERKGWDVGASRVVVRHSRVHARDCAECESTTGMVDHLHREITLAPGLSEEQRAALLTIADKCPVHRTLTGEVRVVTTSADGPAGR